MDITNIGKKEEQILFAQNDQAIIGEINGRSASHLNTRVINNRQSSSKSTNTARSINPLINNIITFTESQNEEIYIKKSFSQVTIEKKRNEIPLSYITEACDLSINLYTHFLLVNSKENPKQYCLRALTDELMKNFDPKSNNWMLMGPQKDLIPLTKNSTQAEEIAKEINEGDIEFFDNEGKRIEISTIRIVSDELNEKFHEQVHIAINNYLINLNASKNSEDEKEDQLTASVRKQLEPAPQYSPKVENIKDRININEEGSATLLNLSPQALLQQIIESERILDARRRQEEEFQKAKKIRIEEHQLKKEIRQEEDKEEDIKKIDERHMNIENQINESDKEENL